MLVARAALTLARLEADLYALTHRGSAGDAGFYSRICDGAESVLELGAGYGRLLVVLARARRRVVGLELDAELLAAARRKLRALPLTARRALRLVRGDMRRFRLGARFERILLPYNGLFCLLTRRDALACFRAVRAALAPGGRFVFDVWNAEAFHRQASARLSAAGSEPIVSLRHAGRTWEVFERSYIRRAAQRLNVSYDYLPRDAAASVRIEIAQRYFCASELTDLLGRAGLSVSKRYGDFSGARFSRRSPHLIVLARAL